MISPPDACRWMRQEDGLPRAGDTQGQYYVERIRIWIILKTGGDTSDSRPLKDAANRNLQAHGVADPVDEPNRHHGMPTHFKEVVVDSDLWHTKHVGIDDNFF